MRTYRALTSGMVSHAHRRKFEDSYIPEPNSGCWLWTGASGGEAGYGSLGGMRAHRVSHVIYNGDIPEGILVRHKCDNSACVNPDHLELGTYQDNMNDCIARGRFVAGRAKLTLEEATEIFNSMRTAKYEAERFGLHVDTVKQIRRGRIWPQVSEGLLPHPKSHLAAKMRRETSSSKAKPQPHQNKE